ncbi:hypothetical protein FRC02_008033 [Tulasnella sp. 418]|nr:hypothetical protein FRC02_008033 [Tulasnella sp. 418]
METKDEKAKFNSPPKLPTRSKGNGQTRFEKETAANGGKVDTFGDPISLGPWILGDTIGKGSSGRVRLARHNVTGKLAAVKIIPKNIMFSSRMSISNASAKHDKLMLGIRREIVIMKLIDHPNIMSLYDVFEADNELYLLLEYIQGGELFDHLVSKGRLTPSEALNYFKQIIHGVNYCHRFNICHRDLKPENLLLDNQLNIKIADFGMAAMEIANGMLETSCGSPHYASPEIVAGRAYHGAASDIWSCGVVLFALLVGRLPFDDPNMRVLLQKVRSGRYDMPAFLPAEAKDLIHKMLVVDPDKRITMSEIMKHPFFVAPYTPRWSSPEPPSLDELARTIPSERDIDPGVFRNLVILWHGTNERKLVEALLSPDVSWEKAYYFLLAKYQAKSLEEYGMGYSFGFCSGRYQPPAHLVKMQSDKDDREMGPIPEKEIMVVGRPSSMVGRRDHIIGRGTIEHTSATRRPPWQPKPSSPGTIRTSVPSSANGRPAPSSPTKRTRPASVVNGPRPLSITKSPNPPTPHHSIGGTVTSPKTRIGASTVVNAAEDRKRMPPPPPPFTTSLPPTTPSPRNSIISADTSAAQAIESANAEIVRARFGFGSRERAEAFAIANSNQSNPVESSNPRGLGFSVTPHAAVASNSRNHARASVTAPVTPIVSQFTTGSTPASPLNISAPVVEDPNLQKFFNDIAGALNTIASPPGTPGANAPYHLNMLQEVNQHSRTASMENGKGGPLIQFTENPSEKTSRASELFRRKSGNGGALMRRASNKENVKGIVTPSRTHEGDAPDDHGLISGPVPSAPRKHRPAPLELSNTPRVSTFLATAPSPLPSPLLAGSEFKGHGWFSSLFNFKPATYVFFSRDNIVVTRRECANLLESFGVSVALEENGDGIGVLKCSVDKIQEVNGTINTKAVRFRAQIQPQSHSTNARTYPITPTPIGFGNAYLQSPVCAPNGSILTLIQERGAKSSLEAVALRLRQEWRLDTLSSAEPSPMFESPLQLA